MSTVLGDPVAEPPLDGVSRVRFSPAAAAAGGGSATLLATSWDGSARLYDASSGAARGVYAHAAPLLDCSFGDDGGTFFTGGLDCRVIRCVRLCVFGGGGPRRGAEETFCFWFPPTLLPLSLLPHCSREI